MFCDTHCHLDFERFDLDRSDVIERSKNAGLVFVINPAIDQETSKAALDLSQQFPGYIYAAVGVQPNYANTFYSKTLSCLRELAEQPEVIAIGEIGLDYYRDYASPELQKNILTQQLELAGSLSLPVILHDREASADLVPILLEWQQSLPFDHALKKRPGVLHAYGDDPDYAESLAKAGFFFGIGGPVTYKNGQKRRELVRQLPLNQIILETDAPFLPPHPHRGQRNEPAYIPIIAAVIAELKNISLNEVGKITTQNAVNLFGITYS